MQWPSCVHQSESSSRGCSCLGSRVKVTNNSTAVETIAAHTDPILIHVNVSTELPATRYAASTAHQPIERSQIEAMLSISQ